MSAGFSRMNADFCGKFDPDKKTTNKQINKLLYNSKHATDCFYFPE